MAHKIIASGDFTRKQAFLENVSKYLSSVQKLLASDRTFEANKVKSLYKTLAKYGSVIDSDITAALSDIKARIASTENTDKAVYEAKSSYIKTASQFLAETNIVLAQIEANLPESSFTSEAEPVVEVLEEPPVIEGQEPVVEEPIAEDPQIKEGEEAPLEPEEQAKEVVEDLKEDLQELDELLQNMDSEPEILSEEGVEESIEAAIGEEIFDVEGGSTGELDGSEMFEACFSTSSKSKKLASAVKTAGNEPFSQSDPIADLISDRILG